MIIVQRFRRAAPYGVFVLAVFVIWFFSGKLLMEFEWNDIADDSTVVDQLRLDLAQGRTGPTLKGDPCMMHQTTIALNLLLDGPFPLAAGRDIVMKVGLFSDNLMVGQIYLGPPTRQLALAALPICLPMADRLPVEADVEALARISVVFYDLRGRKFKNFTGEEAFPILAWGGVRVQWANIPWYMEGGQSYSQIMATPL